MSRDAQNNRSIFRVAALKRYAGSRTTTVAPQFQQLPRFVRLWGVLILLFAAAAWLCTIRVPATSATSADVPTRSILSLLTETSEPVSP